MKIAICDDMEQEQNALLSALTHIREKYNIDFEINVYSSGESFCEDLENEYYDIVFLDILMHKIDGIEVANRLQMAGINSLIIFVSSYDARLKELFGLRTIAFIDKPIHIEKLEEAMKKALSIIYKNAENTFSFKKGKETIYIPIKDIKYFESSRNKIIIHTIKNEEFFYDTLLEVWSRLQGTNEFVMPHRSFIFNLNYIHIKSGTVILKDTSKTFSIGRSYKLDTEERYLRYIEKRYK